MRRRSHLLPSPQVSHHSREARGGDSAASAPRPQAIRTHRPSSNRNPGAGPGPGGAEACSPYKAQGTKGNPGSTGANRPSSGSPAREEWGRGRARWAAKPDVKRQETHWARRHRLQAPLSRGTQVWRAWGAARPGPGAPSRGSDSPRSPHPRPLGTSVTSPSASRSPPRSASRAPRVSPTRSKPAARSRSGEGSEEPDSEERSANWTDHSGDGGNAEPSSARLLPTPEQEARKCRARRPRPRAASPGDPAAGASVRPGAAPRLEGPGRLGAPSCRPGSP